MESKQEQVFKHAHLYQYWKTDIIPFLKELEGRKLPPQKIIDRLVQIHAINYSNSKVGFFKSYKIQKYSLEYLEIMSKQKLSDLLCQLASFLLNYIPNKPIKLLRKGQRKIVQYQRKTLFYLLVLMFFGIVPPKQKQESYNYKRFNNMNSFAHILSNSQFKTICILQYLKNTITSIEQQPEKLVTYLVQRTYIAQTVQQLIEVNRHQKLTKITIQSNQASIEDFNGKVKVDFANRFIGGGCLRDGCVQQEIMFAVRPQLYALTLLCQEMDSDQAIAFTGFKRHFNSKGYGNRTQYAGMNQDKYQYSKNGDSITYNEYIVAIDAVKFNKNDPKQFNKQFIDRQIRKAIAGFSMYKQMKIISGGWGCGVYNGDFETKLLIQWIAATITNNQLVICPFGRKSILQKTNILQILQHYSLQVVYGLLMEAAREKRSNQSLFETIRQLHNK